jgi:hypothetical protein
VGASFQLRLPIPLRLRLAAQAELVMPVLQVVQRVATEPGCAAGGLVADEGQKATVALSRRSSASGPPPT